MNITGGQLIDRYGQTNEAAAAGAELALSAAANAGEEESNRRLHRSCPRSTTCLAGGCRSPI